MTTGVLDELSTNCLREFAYFMTGDLRGRGMSRFVYDHPTDPTKVIKIENAASHFQNVLEWEIWRAFEHTDVGKWLAPCHAISYSGTFLIQEKARDLIPSETPDKLPEWISDHKLTNFGKIGKRIVCRDYGLLTLNPSLRMRKWQGQR